MTSASLSRSAALGLVLSSLSLLISGCIIGGEFIWPDFNRCPVDTDVEETFKTRLGTAKLVQTTYECSGRETWKLEKLGSLTLFEFDSEPDDVEVTVEDPYWLRISAEVDGEEKKWLYMAARKPKGRTDGWKCESSAAYVRGTPTLEDCMGENLGVYKLRSAKWGYVAISVMKDATVFDEHAFRLVSQNRNDPSKVVEGLNYFRDTWRTHDWYENRVNPRSEEAKQAVRKLVGEVECGPILAAGTSLWTQYVSAVESILGEQAQNVLTSCEARLVEHWPDHLDKLRAGLGREFVVEGIDTKLAAFSDQINEEVLRLWGERLQHEPAPSRELVDQMDRHLFEALPRLEEVVKARLASEFALSPPSAQILRDEVVECCVQQELARDAMARPEMRMHHEKLDQAFLDELVGRPDIATLSEPYRKHLRWRMTHVGAYPLSATAASRLDRLLLSEVDALEEEILLRLEHYPDPDAKAKFVVAFDAHVSDVFPEGSGAFITRLERLSLRRPTESTRTKIIDRARKTIAAGGELDDDACKVLRALLMLPDGRSNCRGLESL